MLPSKLNEFKQLKTAISKNSFIYGRRAELLEKLNNFIKNPNDVEFPIWCAKTGDIQLLRLCAKAGVDLTLRNSKSISLMEIAEQNGHPEMVNEIEKLINNQLRVTLQLNEAIKAGKYHSFTGENGVNPGFYECLEKGAVINWKDNLKSTPLIYACENGHVEMVKVLISAGANVNERDYIGATPLMWASWGDKVEILKLLIKAGARVNDKDKENGSTALIWWATNSHDNVEGVNYLIENGANPRISINPSRVVSRDKYDLRFSDSPGWFSKPHSWPKKEIYLDGDRIAIDFARAAGNYKIVAFLERYEKTWLKGLFTE